MSTDDLLLEVPRDWQAYHHASQELQGFVHRLDLPPNVSFVALLVLEEVGTNILKYAYGQPPPEGADRDVGASDFGFRLRVTVLPDSLRMVFEDAGTPFDPTREAELEETSLEEASIGGRGLLLLQRMTRGMRYKHVGGRNVLEVDVPLAGV